MEATLVIYQRCCKNESEADVAERKPNGERKDDKANPEFENFQKVLEQVLSVPKEELEERRAEYERKRKEEKRAG